MRLSVDFLKYHGCGNDFVIVDELDGEVIPERFKLKFAKVVCQRHFSVGADDVLDLVSFSGVDAFMRVLEPDGTETDMCGSGIRCAASYLSEKLEKHEVVIATRAGIRRVEKVGDLFRVKMGVLKKSFGELKRFLNLDFSDEEELLDLQMDFPVLGRLRVSIVDTGIPHLVTFVDDVDAVNLELYGLWISKNKEIFPYGICVDVVEVLSGDSIKVRTYERGVWSETLACGTGSTASAAVAFLLGRVKSSEVNVLLHGGKLKIIVGSPLYMLGPAEKVFSGNISLEL